MSPADLDLLNRNLKKEPTPRYSNQKYDDGDCLYVHFRSLPHSDIAMIRTARLFTPLSRVN